MPARVFIESVDNVAATTRRLARSLRVLEATPVDATVYIKLNLSAVDTRVNTSIEVVESLVSLLREKTADINLCEADGIRHTADEAFERNGFTNWAQERDVSLVNLSHVPQVDHLDPLMQDFGFPRALLRADKVFISLPVIKTHNLTTFTGSIKNQWGTVPRVDRILLHKHLDQLLPMINKWIGVDFAIMGGEWAMEGRGPTSGRTKRYPVMLASSKIASLDATAMRLIGLDPADCRHLTLSDSTELGPIGTREIEVVGDPAGLAERFEPAHLDWASRTADRLARHPFFVNRVLLNRQMLDSARWAVEMGRKLRFVR